MAPRFDPTGARLENLARVSAARRAVDDVLKGDSPTEEAIKSFTGPSSYTDVVKCLEAEVPRHNCRHPDIVAAWNRNVSADLRPLAFLAAFGMAIPSRQKGLKPGPVALESIQELPASEVRDAVLAALGHFKWESASRGVRAAAVLGMIGCASVERRYG